MKLLNKKLLENASGEYLAQLGVTYHDTFWLIKLVQTEVNRRRTAKEKDGDYQRLEHGLGQLHAAHKHLKFAYNERQEGRYKAKIQVNDLELKDE